MKKLFIAAALVASLAACGGGGTGSIRWDSTGIYNVPYVPGEPTVAFNSADGIWNCTNPNEPNGDFQASMTVSGVELAWSGTWPKQLDPKTGKPHTAYLQYNDISGNVGKTVFYSEKRPDVDPVQGFNTWSFVPPALGSPAGSFSGVMTFSVSGTPLWTAAIADKVWTCNRPV